MLESKTYFIENRHQQDLIYRYRIYNHRRNHKDLQGGGWV